MVEGFVAGDRDWKSFLFQAFEDGEGVVGAVVVDDVDMVKVPCVNSDEQFDYVVFIFDHADSGHLVIRHDSTLGVLDWCFFVAWFERLVPFCRI